MKKYEREIRELLDKMDSFVPENPAPEKERIRDREPEREARKRPVGVMPPQPIPIRSKKVARAGLREWLAENKVGLGLQLMIGGLLLVVAALMIAQLTNNNPSWLPQLLAGIGGLVFLFPVFIRFFGGKYVDEDPQYWRGEEVSGGNKFTWAALKNWFGGNRRSKNPSRNPKDPWNNNNKRW